MEGRPIAGAVWFLFRTGYFLAVIEVYIRKFCVNLYKGIYLFEIKRVRRITSFSGNELATVLIAVVCIALLIRVTLTDAKIKRIF